MQLCRFWGVGWFANLSFYESLCQGFSSRINTSSVDSGGRESWLAWDRVDSLASMVIWVVVPRYGKFAGFRFFWAQDVGVLSSSFILWGRWFGEKEAVFGFDYSADVVEFGLCSAFRC